MTRCTQCMRDVDDVYEASDAYLKLCDLMAALERANGLVDRLCLQHAEAAVMARQWIADAVRRMRVEGATNAAINDIADAIEKMAPGRYRGNDK